MKKKKEWQPKKKSEAIKLPKQAIQEIGEKQYAQAMKHMKKFNNYEAERKVYVEPLDPQCTFTPKLLTNSYKGFVRSPVTNTKRSDKKPENRLIQWGHQKQRRHIEKILNFSVEIESKVQKNLRSSLEKSKTKSYLQKHFLTSNNQTARELSPTSRKYQINNGLGQKQNSETTIFRNNKKSLSSLFK